MATQTIHGYSAASTVDPTADFLLIDPASSGIYNKINRNVLLAITGNPLGTTDTQNVTNKTLDNTNILTLRRDRFTLQDSSDTTKQANFILSGITTGTTRSYTLPNASSTLADISSTQTLTNKTLTSPTINGGTIDNTTITVDSISGHTTSTIVTVGGVQLNNGTIGTSNAVVTASIADGAVTPAKLFAGTGTGWSLSPWTPGWTNFTPGNGTNASKYIQIGKLAFILIDFTLGNSSAVTGNIIVTLPVTLRTYGTSAYIGAGNFINTGTAEYQFVAEYNSTTTAILYAQNAAGTYVTNTAASSTIPFTWIAGSRIAGTIIAEVA